MNYKIYALLVTVIVSLIMIGCETNVTEPNQPDKNQEFAITESMDVMLSRSTDYSNHTLVLGYAEYITDPASDEAGGIEWFQKDLGNAQLESDYVYQDPRSTWNDPEAGLTYGVKEGNQSSDTNLTNQIGWMHDSIKIWDNQACADLTLSENDISDDTPGVVENFFNTGIINFDLIESNLTQVGFLGVSSIFPPGSSTLGVAYTLTWVDENGVPTDIDNNGKTDVAFREIYYNDQFEWADNGLEGPQPDGTSVFDFPTVAIHEAGHGVSLAHFGNIGLKKGSLFAAPRSIMNAIYGGLLREPVGRDNGSFCSNWAQWPNK